MLTATPHSHCVTKALALIEAYETAYYSMMSAVYKHNIEINEAREPTGGFVEAMSSSDNCGRPLPLRERYSPSNQMMVESSLYIASNRREYSDITIDAGSAYICRERSVCLIWDDTWR